MLECYDRPGKRLRGAIEKISARAYNREMSSRSSGLQDFPFLFVGAGDASYFEWAEVHVCFTREPTAAEKEAIAAKVPKPLCDSIDFAGVHLMVASDQHAHVWIAENYQSDPASEDDEDTDIEGEDEDSFDEDGEGRFFFAETSQVTRFNEHIERWLHEAHAICPILVAYRHEDWESGGTELSDWHTASVARIPEILPAFESVLEASDDHPRAHMLGGILHYSLTASPAQDIPGRFRAYVATKE